jgi:hypothetical protein
MNIIIIILTLSTACLAVAAGMLVDGGSWIFFGGYFNCLAVTYVLYKLKGRP